MFAQAGGSFTWYGRLDAAWPAPARAAANRRSRTGMRFSADPDRPIAD